MNFDFLPLSENTQATLLLCGTFGRSADSVSPLTLQQYNELMHALKTLHATPGELLLNSDLVANVCAIPSENKRIREPLSVERIRRLLDRGLALSMSLEKWARVGIHVSGRSDAEYPKRMKSYLGKQAPALLYWIGNPKLFEGGGMAFVGSRDIAPEAEEAIRRTVRRCVDAGMFVVSGGARGADQAAMREAFECGGNVIGALASDLRKASLDKTNRNALASGNALLFSAFDPESGFSVGNAMARNKHIYAMADYAFVAQSDVKGGTWEGALEELKRKEHHPVFVYSPKELPEGNRELIKRGGIAWKADADFATMLTPSPIFEKTTQGEFDFFANSNAESIEEPQLAVGESVGKYNTSNAGRLLNVVIELLSNALQNGPLKEKKLRERVDPEKYLSSKGWIRCLEEAVIVGKIKKIDCGGKRGVLYERC